MVSLEAVDINIPIQHTLIVRVASTLAAAAVAREPRSGIDLPLLPLTASLLAKRAWAGRRAVRPTALGRRTVKRENILKVEGDRSKWGC